MADSVMGGSGSPSGGPNPKAPDIQRYRDKLMNDYRNGVITRETLNQQLSLASNLANNKGNFNKADWEELRYGSKKITPPDTGGGDQEDTGSGDTGNGDTGDGDTGNNDNNNDGGNGDGTPFEPPPGEANPFSASELLENLIFAATGISGMGPWASGLYNQGASAQEIVQALRYGTDKSEAGQKAYQQYLAAFPMMDTFLREGIFAGESPELQYIEYRNTVRDAAQRYGINDNLVSNDRIAQYIVNRNSAVEIVDRMGMAATAVATTPAETIGILRDYYGVNNGDLISFYLDPEETEAMLTKRYTAARIGTEAARQKFGIQRTEAERLAERGISIAEAEQGFAQAATQSSLMQGFGETASRGDILGAAFGEQEAAAKVARIAGSRAGRFQEGGAFASGESGVGGLGTSTTR